MLFLSPRTLKYFSELKNDSQVSLVRFGELHPVFVLNMSIKLSLTVLYNQIVLTKYCVIYTYESPSLSRIYWILCDMSIAFPSYKIVWNCKKYFLVFFHKFLLNIWYFESFTIAIMTWLTVTENLCHKWPRIYFPVIFSFMTYHRVCSKSSTTGTTNGTSYPSGAAEVTLIFSGIRAARFLVFCVVSCRLLFVFFLFNIVLFVLLGFMDPDCFFGIFKPLFRHYPN